MTQKKHAPILLADDIALDTEREKRSSSVTHCASRLAQRLNAAIHLVHVEDLLLYPVRTPQYKPLIERHFQNQKSKLASVAKLIEAPTKTFFLNGAPATKILSMAAKRGAYEMVVVGTHGRTGLRRVILGSVAEEIIRQARIPVMTVGPKAQEKASEFLAGSKTTIFIPTSLTPNSARAEVYGIELARRLGAEVIFFHAMREALHPVLQTAFASSSSEGRDYFEKLKASAVKELTQRAAQASRKKVTASHIIDSETLSASDAVLAETSRSAASIIVVGTHGRSVFSSAIFGRTARDVILASPVPVVTVRSKSA
jgi:nucleotide-binding universal stress UspA family protein